MSREFTFIVTVECQSQQQADQVIAERLGYDEDYGFDYSLEYCSSGEQGPVLADSD